MFTNGYQSRLIFLGMTKFLLWRNPPQGRSAYDSKISLVDIVFFRINRKIQTGGVWTISKFCLVYWGGAPVAFRWFVSSFAETNRTLFDLAEGELELISGFNVKYRRRGFALIFLAEYCRIIFMGMIFSFVCVCLGEINLTIGYLLILVGVRL